MRVLVIDDLRTFAFPDDVEVSYARTSLDAVALFEQHGRWDSVLFDHDLGGEDTIAPVLNYLDRRSFDGNPILIGEAVIVSSNPVGRSLIARAMKRHCKVVPSIDVPFTVENIDP